MKFKTIWVEPKGNDRAWVKVEFNNGQTWVPAFWELGEILKEICALEQQIYSYGEGQEMPFRYLREYVFSGKSKETLAEEFKISKKEESDF